MIFISLTLLGPSDEIVVVNSSHIVSMVPSGPHHAIVCTTIDRLHVVHTIEEILAMINKSETQHASN